MAAVEPALRASADPLAAELLARLGQSAPVRATARRPAIPYKKPASV